jgi:transcription elongation factor GreA
LAGKKGRESMNNDKEVILTLEGLAKLEKELEILKTVKRREVAERIKQALEFGDISENSEYEDAKNEQGFIEGRILLIGKMLRNAKVIDEQEIHADVVSIGSKVTLIETNGTNEVEYMIVGSAEADPDQAKISNESPVGRSLMGQKVGSIINVNVPIGTIQYKIKAIKK